MFGLPMAHKGAVIYGAWRSIAAPRDTSGRAASVGLTRPKLPSFPLNQRRGRPQGQRRQALKIQSRVPRQPPGTSSDRFVHFMLTFQPFLRNVPVGDSTFQNSRNQNQNMEHNVKIALESLPFRRKAHSQSTSAFSHGNEWPSFEKRTFMSQ